MCDVTVCMKTANARFSPRLETTTLGSTLRSVSRDLDASLVRTAAFERAMVDVVRQLSPAFAAGRDVQIQYFSGGITNTLACVSLATPDGTQRCLVRVYGNSSSFLIDRNHELIVMAEHPQAPKLFGRFENGYCCAYTPGHTMSVDEARQSEVSAQTAEALARVHVCEVPSLPRKPLLFPTMKHWLGNIPVPYGNNDPHKQASMARFGGMDALAAEVAWLESAVTKLDANAAVPVRFCHNDLLFGNILRDDELHRVRFIDWEYSFYGYAPHDIANHFCEWAGFECEWSKYPTVEEQRHFIGHYLATLAMLEHTPQPSDADVSRWLQLVQWFDLSANLFWGVWALLQGAISKIDFDYVSYAVRRIERYLAQKATLLESTANCA